MLRTLILTAAAAIALGALPVVAAPAVGSSTALALTFGPDLMAKHGADDKVKERRHGRDDGAGHDKRRPRTPGGSGCDDPRDVREHPECRA